MPAASAKWRIEAFPTATDLGGMHARGQESDLLERRFAVPFMSTESGELHAVRALAAAVDARDGYTRYHSLRVSGYARLVAERLACSARHVHAIAVAGELHDVGKLALRDSILLKETQLDPAELEAMKAHAVEGERIVRLAGLDAIAPWIRHHHERWDGGGYPDGLVGAEASLESRILVAADSLDAMTTDRSYKLRLDAREARAELKRNAGSQFDPCVVQVVLALFDEGAIPYPIERGIRVQLTTNGQSAPAATVA